MKPHKFYPSRDIQIIKNLAPHCQFFIVGPEDHVWEIAGILNTIGICPIVHETAEQMVKEMRELLEDKE